MGKAVRYAMPATFKVSCELNDVTVFHVNVFGMSILAVIVFCIVLVKSFLCCAGKATYHNSSKLCHLQIRPRKDIVMFHSTVLYVFRVSVQRVW